MYKELVEESKKNMKDLPEFKSFNEEFKKISSEIEQMNPHVAKKIINMADECINLAILTFILGVEYGANFNENIK